METQVHHGGVGPGVRPQAQLRVYLLGRFEVVRADAPIPPHAWRRRRPADLLKLVALAPRHALPRETAIDTLWPDKDPASGANNLHRALYDLRQILGGRWVDIDRGQVALRSDVWVDVDAFERAISEGGREGWQAAVALYGGDLSPEDPESPWLQARRAALRARFVEAALPLARLAAAEGDAQLAIPLLRRVLAADAAIEDAHSALMRLLAENGRRAEALRQYDACEVALRAGGLSPSDETRQLRAAIQRGEIGPARVRPSADGARRAARRLLGTTEPPPVRGRGPLLLLLETLVEQGVDAPVPGGGCRRVLVLLGERGVGKTRLAVEGARLAQARGAAVLCGTAGGAPGVAYALFQDVLREQARLDPAAPDPLAAFAGTGRVAGEGVRRAIFDGVERALVAAAEGRPVYLLLDDLHLADESSLNIVHLLARRARELRLMIVGTVSEEAIHAGTPIQTALAHLDCGRLARGVRVPRLGLAATREQMQDLLGAPAPEAIVAQIYRTTDGAPLLVEELVRAQREAGQPLVPGDPAAAIRGRVARLGPRAEALLAAAAAAGDRFEFEPVRLVSGLTAHEAIAALEACLDARVLDEDGAGYHFHHALVRDAIEAGLAPERLAVLHGALADALEGQGAAHEPAYERIAHHRRRAGQDDRAVRPLVAAGHRAAARAGLREALAFYDAALALAARPGALDGAERFELLDATGRVQLGLGELPGAARAFGEAARLSGPDLRLDRAAAARAHRLAALALAAGGHLAAAHAELDEGVGAAGANGGDGLAPLLHLRAQLLWHDGRAEEARAAAGACAAAAAQAGDAELLARGRDLEALAAALLGAPPASAGDGATAEPRLEDAAPDDPIDLHLALWDRDLVALDAPAVARLSAALGERARARGADDALATARSGDAAAALAEGQLDLAEAALRAARAGHRAVGSALGEALALERTAALLVMRGRLDEALDTVDEGIVIAERASLRRHALTRLHATEARVRLASGALHAAEDAIGEVSETAARHGECTACDAAFRPEAVRVLLARRRVDEARLEAAQLEEIARQRGGATLRALAAATRARVLAADGQRDEALTLLGAARAALAAAGHRYEAARCARLEIRLRGPAAPLPDDVRLLDPLVVVDADA
ncbi:MAG TPA: BTAD domain-containing putative transcriptional regulator [Anaeromyxobacter sp.]|nr:BTAD domain-containing putative transcriptional regulator [Anaeromyxobacter sp.]